MTAPVFPTIQPDTSRAILGAKLRVAQAEVDQQARIGCRLLVEGKLDLALMHAIRAEEAQVRVDELAAEIRGAAADRQAALA